MSCNHDHEHDDCCCDGEHENKMNLVLEDDRELMCDVVGIFALSEEDEQEYIALLPEGEEEVLLYRYFETDDGVELENIEDDDEFQEVSECFEELFLEEYEEEIGVLEELKELEKLEK